MTGYDGALPNPRGVKLTYDDFVLFPDDGLRHELIDGEHYVTPSPSLKHQHVSFNLTLQLGKWLEQHPVGRLYYAPLDVVLSKHDVVEPDILYLSNERSALVATDANLQGPPELVIEISSPSTRMRDLTIKCELYGRAGVSEYWFVDTELDVVLVYRRLHGNRFAEPEELSLEARDVLTTLLLPGLELTLVDVFHT